MFPPADTIPVATAADSISRTEIALSEAPATTVGRNILVIDDSALIRAAAKIALGAIDGWRTVTASCGEEGIELAVSEHFDVILLDVEMPGMDGIAVAERLQATPATNTLPIVLLTAHEHIEASARWLGAGIAGVIVKPFDVADLARQVAVLLRWPA
ncbi:MAG TPA: response regulator [Solirubrobacteraceae bacterium]|jgi:CheY-like chemotaxis protein|nr:response regulator [Solirubrobacteraceae bacterium]